MKLLFVADGRSPTTAGWIGYFPAAGHEVHLVSTYPAEPLPGLASFTEIPGVFAAASAASGGGSGSRIRRMTAPGLRTAVRRLLEARTIHRRARRLREVIRQVEPDLVHALRIPFEGILAAGALSPALGMAMRSVPLVLSVWGNDFTLHAAAGKRMGEWTRTALQQASAVIADCARDIRLAHQWGFPPGMPTTVLPGGGGVRAEIFFPGDAAPEQPMRIVQPRGLRAYVENEAFLHAVPAVLARYPETRFSCPGLKAGGNLAAVVDQLGIGRAIDLLPPVSQPELAALFRSSAIVLSPTTHDGTPNSLLEALACGCFPVAGDLESIREWITPGENGLLVDAGDPKSIARGILDAIDAPTLRAEARKHNLQLISERALYRNVMPQASDFYSSLT
jgi:hypothetical protein